MATERADLRATRRVSREWQTQASLVNFSGHFGVQVVSILRAGLVCFVFMCLTASGTCAVVVGGAPLAHLDGMPMVSREWQTQPVFSLVPSRLASRSSSVV